MERFAFASLVPFGRERCGVLLRAADHDAADEALMAEIESLLGLAVHGVLRYADKRRGQRRTMRLAAAGADQRLEAFVLAGDISAEAWIRPLLQDEQAAQAFGRLLLLPGAKPPVATAARGRQVCSCFDVGEARIADTLRGCSGTPDEQLEQLQSALKCGTNCGSCLPEVKRFVRLHQQSLPDAGVLPCARPRACMRRRRDNSTTLVHQEAADQPAVPNPHAFACMRGSNCGTRCAMPSRMPACADDPGRSAVLQRAQTGTAIAPYIKEIGRGKDGARSLTREQAYDLMSQVLDLRVTDLEIGAFALSMRIKGETCAELAGFLEAVEERCIAIRSEQPVLVLPSYNGSRKLPNLTALLALLLAQEGIAVLVHGPQHDPTARDHRRHLSRPRPALRPFGRRHQRRLGTPRTGVRAHRGAVPAARAAARRAAHRRAAQLRAHRGQADGALRPLRHGSAMRVVNYTHPEYATLQAEFLALTQADAMLMRGTEGEPVADVRRTPKLDVYVGGVLREDLSRPAQEGVLTELPVLPRSNDAATTALYIQSVVSGAKPAPSPILQQVDSLVRTLAVLQRRGLAEQTA